MQRSSSTKLRVPCFHPFYASSLMQAIGDHAPRWPPLRAEAGSLKSSNAPNCTPSPCCPSDGSSSVPSRGSTDVEDWPRIGRTSIARRSLSCASLQSVSCCENFAIQSDVSGQTLRDPMGRWIATGTLEECGCNHPLWGRPCKLDLTDLKRRALSVVILVQFSFQWNSVAQAG